MTPGLVLTLREEPTQRLDLSPLVPERLAGLDAGGIARLALRHGTRSARVGDLFDVAPGDPADITLVAGGPRLDRIGAGMGAGRITVEGDAGAYAGLGMSGGTIHVRGGAGHGAATGLAGGLVRIDGDAGDVLGGALPGAMTGMCGGTVLVGGDAGARAGDRMRRGVIVVEGSVGPYAGSRMIAGTLAALGPEVGPWAGFGMRRGTLLVAAEPARLLPSFADAGTHDIGFLRLFLRAYADRSPGLAALGPDAVRVRRLVGDLAAGGRGELLIWPEREAA